MVKIEEMSMGQERKVELEKFVGDLKSIVHMNESLITRHELLESDSEVTLTCVLRDYDLIDADLDFDEFQYAKITNNLNDTLLSILEDLLRKNIIDRVILNIYKEWMNGAEIMTDQYDVTKVVEDSRSYLVNGHTRFTRRLC
jgi:hypothetical protein